MPLPVPEASRFVPITMTNLSLTQTLPRTATQLPVELSPTLRDLLAGGAFTYMTISNAVDIEVVKVYLFDGKLLMERGIDGTEPTAFPKGSCVDTRPTWAGISELICTLDCCDDAGRN